MRRDRPLKTPWNPSRKATARVKNPLPMPTECSCCGGDRIDIVENGSIYGRNYGDWPWLVICLSCEAYVGLHPFTAVPMGTLADERTRKARKECKAPFESLHHSGRLTRTEAYQRLAAKMGIPLDECHFGVTVYLPPCFSRLLA